MVELIQQLLFTHNCVIIPNFGAFIGNYAPSEVILRENKITPPSKSIAFNRTLKHNDGILINAAAQYFQLSYADAEMRVSAFAADCNQTLAQQKSLIFPNIGRWIADAENNIIFQPYLTVNYLPQSYGLHTLSLEPIRRLKDEAVAMQNKPLNTNQKELSNTKNIRTGRRLIYTGVAILTVIGIASSIIFGMFSTHNHRNETSLAPTFDSSTKLAAPAIAEKAIIENTTNTTVATLVDTTVTPKESVEMNTNSTSAGNTVVISPPLATYIVIGAFFDAQRADKLKAEAESKGYTVHVSKDTINGLYRTAITTEDANTENALQKIKTEINSRAWVYCVNCSINN